MIVQKNLKSRSEVLPFIEKTMKVIDIGGGAHPCNRADYVMDIQPYEAYQANKPGNLGHGWFDGPVNFNQERWIVHNISDKSPFPFPDNFFDFSICTQTLEDIRDPIWAISEISRISRGGYIEVPSMQYERSNVESPYYAGACHHRWLIEIEDNRLKFLFKYAFVHVKDLYLEVPKDFQSKNISCIWKDSIEAFEKENMEWGGDGIISELTGIQDSRKLKKLSYKIHNKSLFIADLKQKLKKIRIVKNLHEIYKNYS